MAIKPDYQAGTITVAANGTIVTGVGTLWVSADIQPGDTLKVKNLDAVIATVTSNTSITLVEPWTGGALTASTYRIRYQPDGSRFTAAVRDLVTQLTNGVLQGLAALGSAASSIVYYDAGGNPQLRTVTDAAVNALSIYDRRPIVILVTGQSNATLRQTYSWSVPSNLKLWNYSYNAGNVGTAFVLPAGDVMGLALAYGKKLAKENPHREVFIINIALGANTIGGWLPSVIAPDRDVYTDIVNNVPVALAAIGATQIDAYVWWQVEGDKGALAAYPAKFETMMARMRTNAWFKESTPTIIHGCSSNAISSDPTYGPCNKTLQAVANADPQRRKFVYTAAINTSLWTDTPKIHMTGAGYEQAGEMGVDAFFGRTNGIQQQFVFDMDSPYANAMEPEVTSTSVTVAGTTTAGVGTYTQNSITRWRTGKRVEYVINIICTGHTGTGGMVINGVPDLLQATVYPTVYSSGLTFTGQLSARILATSPAQIQVVQLASNAVPSLVSIDTSFTLILSGTYYIA